MPISGESCHQPIAEMALSEERETGKFERHSGNIGKDDAFHGFLYNSVAELSQHVTYAKADVVQIQSSLSDPASVRLEEGDDSPYKSIPLSCANYSYYCYFYISGAFIYCHANCSITQRDLEDVGYLQEGTLIHSRKKC